ncbi:MAG: dienelactone hydrolase family protein [Gemmataceae bacterium]|nr:dienelactone hydrolase family protein [Gemmataceae bacterium]
MRSTRKFWAALVLLPLLVESASAQVKGREITIKSGDEDIKAYVVEPAGKGPFPAIVVIQEWWGLNDNIKDNAKKLAAKGFVCLAPDLYRGKVATEMKTASALAKNLPADRAVRDLKASVDHLAKLPNVEKGKIGSIGWCMGGGYSLQLALNDPRVKACVICYGRVVTDPAKLEPIKATILGIFGVEDKGIPAATVREFEKALRKAGGKSWAIHIFNGAGHGFMRPGTSDMPNPAHREMQTREAWQQIERFFEEQLKK